MMNTARTNETTTLLQKVTSITEEFLGPATDRFVSRQILSHLNKPAADILPEDLQTLLKWTKVTLGHLTEDTQMIDDYVRQMNELIHSLHG